MMSQMYERLLMCNSNLLRPMFAAVLVALLLVPATFAAEGTWETMSEQDADGKIPGWMFYSEDTETQVQAVWQLSDGLLVCQGSPKGYLYTEKNYTDFVLRLQWRWPSEASPANGGVLLRMTGEHKIWPRSLEAQINAGDAGDFWGLGGYQLEGPAERTRSIE